MRNLHQDVIMGSIIILVSAFLYARTYEFPGGAALWPRIVLVSLTLLALWVVFKGIRKTKKMKQGEAGEYEGEEEALTLRLLRLPLSTFLVVAVYATLLIVIGFFPATVLFLGGYFWYGGVRNWKVYALTIVGTNLFIYWVFVLQLNVRLPTGLFLQ